MFKPLLSTFVLGALLLVHAQTKPKTTTQKAPAKPAAQKPAAAKTTKKPVAVPKIAFKLSGTLEGYSNYLIVINKFRAHSLELIDSTRTNELGEFKFSKTLPENSIVYLQYSANTAVPLIIENGADIHVKVYPSNSSLNYELSGVKSEKSASLYQFIKNFSKMSSELGGLEKQIASEGDAVKSYQLQLMFSLKQQEYQMSIDSMIHHKTPLESYFVLFNFFEEHKAADVKSIMTRMEPKEIKSNYYADLKKIYDDSRFLEIGELAPDIDLPQPDGSSLKLSELRGKVVLIDFWASWCGPCRAEFPNVKRVYTRFKDKGFEIYGVSLDNNRNAWVSSISSLGLNWKHVSDIKGWSCAPAKVYKVSGIPFTVLIDKEGKILAKNLRGEELERKLEELFP